MKTKRIILIEGADGAGKTLLAHRYATRIDAVINHHGPYPGLSPKALANVYVDAMLPALNGKRNVIMDRCWWSEPIYGAAYRGGADRIGRTTARMLDRLALRCGAVLILCDPGWESVRANWSVRKELGHEYLDNSNQLRQVYEGFDEPTRMPSVFRSTVIDYNTEPTKLPLMQVIDSTNGLHDVDALSAGNLNARTVLVGDSFASWKPGDHTYRWPFASWSDAGCSRWFTNQLDSRRLKENELFWVNADQPFNWKELRSRKIFALGRVASKRLEAEGLEHSSELHPQFWKRFGFHLTYPLLARI